MSAPFGQGRLVLRPETERHEVRWLRPEPDMRGVAEPVQAELDLDERRALAKDPDTYLLGYVVRFGADTLWTAMDQWGKPIGMQAEKGMAAIAVLEHARARQRRAS